MTYDEFAALPEEQQRAAYIDMADFENLQAERNSLQTENEDLQKQIKEVRDSEKKTKEVNYTLSRKLNITADKKDAETILHEMFK